MASPASANQLLLFGGEYFNGALATFFNDLSVYYIDRDEWRTVTSPNAPLPRGLRLVPRRQPGAPRLPLRQRVQLAQAGAPSTTTTTSGASSATREWLRLDPRARPPARSGHRMTYFQAVHCALLAASRTPPTRPTILPTCGCTAVNFVWHSPALPPPSSSPTPAASLCCPTTRAPYCTAATAASRHRRLRGGRPRAAAPTKNVLKPMVHQDCFFLRIAAPGPTRRPTRRPWCGGRSASPPTRRTRRGPVPPWRSTGPRHHVWRRARRRGERGGHGQQFFNQLFAWNIERNRFFPLALRKPQAGAGKKGGGEQQQQRGGGQGRAQANEEELLRQLAALQAGGELEDADEMELDRREDEAADEDKDKKVRDMPVSSEMPHPRFSAQLAVRGDALYIYGGTFEEKGDREFTFDDLYAVDLGKMDGCKEISAGRLRTGLWVSFFLCLLAVLYPATLLTRSVRERRTAKMTMSGTMRTRRRGGRRRRRRRNGGRTRSAQSCARQASARRAEADGRPTPRASHPASHCSLRRGRERARHGGHLGG